MGPTRPLNDEELAARNQRQVLEKDATEIELEKILFGDQAGFLDSLNTVAHEDRALIRQDGSDDEHDDDMADVPDDDLFFLDAGTTELPDDVMEDLQEEKEDEEHARKVLWYDSDDEKIRVSLASNTRLRKLRDTEDDDVVSGLEYIRRLRRQYERLRPTPEWVKYARKKLKTKYEDEDSDSDVEIDDASVMPLSDILRSTGTLTTQTKSSKQGLKLRPEVIDIQRQKDIARSGPSSVDVLQFHPQHPILLTAGPSSTINLYHVSPNSQNANPLLTSLHVKGTPITSALFSTSNTDSDSETKIYFSARRRYFHTWSLTNGQLTKVNRPLYQSRNASDGKLATKKRNHELPTTERMILSPDSAYIAIIANTGSNGGVVHLLSAASHQPVAQVRVDSMNGIADLAFHRDSSGFVVVGKNGEVSENNIAERRVVGRWMDEGAVGTTTIALGGRIKDAKSETGTDAFGNDRWIAIGSTSGIVNVYDRRTIMAHFVATTKARPEKSLKGNLVVDADVYRPKPLRVFDHLTTPVSHLVFDPAHGQMLVMASRWKKNALRLVHLPSCTVYRNWPTEKTPLGRISAVAVSQDGAYLAVGNEKGQVRLWQVRD